MKNTIGRRTSLCFGLCLCLGIVIIQDFWNRKGLVSEQEQRKTAFYVLQGVLSRAGRGRRPGVDARFAPSRGLAPPRQARFRRRSGSSSRPRAGGSSPLPAKKIKMG